MDTLAALAFVREHGVVEKASRLRPEAALAALDPALVTKPGQRNPREQC